MRKLGWAWQLSRGGFFRFTAPHGSFYVYADKPSPMWDEAQFAAEHPGRWVRVPVMGRIR